jgi:hypothetical protein
LGGRKRSPGFAQFVGAAPQKLKGFNMSAAHPLAVRNKIADLIVDRLDAGAAPGQLVLCTATGVAVATFTLAKPAFGDAIDGIATAAEFGEAVAEITGTVAKARFLDGYSNPVFDCSVTKIGGDGDIQLSEVTIDSGMAVTINPLSYTAPP